MAPRFELPRVHALYNLLFLGMEGTCEYDKKSFSWLGFVLWKRQRDCANSINVLVSWFWVNQKVVILGRPDLISWALKKGSKRDSHDVFEKADCCNFYNFMEISSANEHMKLEEHPKPQMKSTLFLPCWNGAGPYGPYHPGPQPAFLSVEEL